MLACYFVTERNLPEFIHSLIHGDMVMDSESVSAGSLDREALLERRG